MQALSGTSDASLVASVLAGDTEAFAVLLGRYRDAYTRFAVRMLGNMEDADDALQLAFLRGYRHLASCKEPERFRAWLFQIVVNECRTFGTRRGRRELRVVRDDVELERAAGPDAPDVLLREEIQRALRLLDVEQREAFVLKHVEELSYDEMAELTGAGISALKMRVKRACERLRELLEGVHQ
jgi:RNA polymerase sigma-70 factor (ECF subfamily)